MHLSRWARPILVLGVGPAVIVLSSFACGRAHVPEPDYRAHPTNAAEALCVPYPPPAAKPEDTGAPPSSRAVWVDGEWIWHSRGGPPGAMLGKWEWKGGGWEEPPSGASYSRGTLVRMKNGSLAWYPPHWHTSDQYKSQLDASVPISASGTPLECPAPEKEKVINGPPNVHDAGEEAHVGPALEYPADAPSSAPPKVIPDAVVPSDAKQPPQLISPPTEGP